MRLLECKSYKKGNLIERRIRYESVDAFIPPSLFFSHQSIRSRNDMDNIIRGIRSEQAIRDAEQQPPWQAKETVKRIQTLKEEYVSHQESPPVSEQVRQDMISVCDGFIKVLGR